MHFAKTEIRYAREEEMETSTDFAKTIRKSSKMIARRALKQQLQSKESVFAAFTVEMEVLHNAEHDINIGDLKSACKTWLLKKPGRAAKAAEIDTQAMQYLLS
jgi:hypothetical protein